MRKIDLDVDSEAFRFLHLYSVVAESRRHLRLGSSLCLQARQLFREDHVPKGHQPGGKEDKPACEKLEIGQQVET